MTDVTNRTLLSWAALSLACTVGTWVFYYYWMQSEWMNFPGPFPKLWKGYTVFDFIYIFFFTILAPLSFFSVVGLLQVQLRKYGAVSKGAFFGIAFVYLSFLIGHIAFGAYTGWDQLRCGVIMCVHEKHSKFPPYKTLVPQAAMGFESTIGLSYFFSAFVLLLFVSGGLARFYKYTYMTSGTSDYSAMNNPITKSLLVKDKKRGVLLGLLLGVFLLVGFLFFLITQYIPNNWEYMSAQRIANFAALIATTDPDLCARWTEYTCPEIAGATMRTWSLAVHDNFNFKVFPSNTIFFSTLAGITVFAYISTQIGGLKRIFDKKVKLAFRKRQAFFSIREIVCILYIIVMAYLFYAYWFFSHNWNNYWPDVNPVLEERWSRTMGQVAVFFLGLLMFPTARNSPILALAGVSWEAAIQYHRWLGVLFFVASIGHVVATYAWYATHKLFPSEVWNIPNSLPTSVDNFTVPMIQLIFYISLVTIGVMAIWEPFRRKHFDIFLFAHHFTYLTLIPAVFWHAQAAWEYVLPGVMIWFVERAVRLTRSHLAYPLPLYSNTNNFAINDTGSIASVRAYSAGAAGEFVELRIPAPFFSYQPGQYVFLNVMEVSLVEWHPFTIMSPVHPDINKEVGLCIKAMGPGTWTESLYKFVSQQQEHDRVATLTVSLDGPYGHPLDYTQYDGVMLVGGGIGITPCKSIFESLYLAKSRTTSDQECQLTHVGLYFAARDVDLFNLVKPCLTSISDIYADTFSAKLYLNNPDRKVPEEEISKHALASYMQIGSQTLANDLKTAASLIQGTDGTAPKILLFVCGPEGLAKSMESLAYENNWDYHTETFAL